MDKRLITKAKRVDNSEWVTGFFYTDDEGDGWVFNKKEDWSHQVDPETVCQHTGHPRDIFENDIVHYWNYLSCNYKDGIVQWDGANMRYIIVSGDWTVEMDRKADPKPTGRNFYGD